MKLMVEGNIPVHRYYVQMLCMIYYPGMTFSQSEVEGGQSLTLKALVEREDDTVTATLTLIDEEKSCTASHSKTIDSVVSEDKAMKLALGGAMYKIGSEMLDYRPSWGILTGVRPSKVATEFLSEGNSKTRVKKILTGDYMVTPKKALEYIDERNNPVLDMMIQFSTQEADSFMTDYYHMPFNLRKLKKAYTDGIVFLCSVCAS